MTERENVNELEKQVRRIVERALRDWESTEELAAR